MITSRDFQRLMYAQYSVREAQNWVRQPGLEYWLQPGALSQGVGAFSGGVLGATSNGWVNTGTILGVAGSAADFGSTADKGTPNHFAIDTAGDLLNSPALFGDYHHMAIAAALAGIENTKGEPEMPRFLIYDTWGTSFDAGANETASGHGFVEDGGSAAVANDHLAAFFCDGTSFKLRNDTATSAALMAKDTNPHRWRVVIDNINALAYAYIDDMSTALGSIAIKADEFPASVGAGVLASTGTNFIKWGPVRVRYAWDGWV